MTLVDQAQIHRVLGRFANVRRSALGDAWSALCPAHEDSRRSLSIGVGRNGALVLYCHAGCETAAVLTAAGLAYADLYPPARDRRR